MSETAPIPDRRAGSDRRRRPTPALSRYWLVGRRRGGRRTEEQRVYVDRHRPAEYALVLGTLALVGLDTAFTLVHLERGATEANPLMAWVLAAGGFGGFIAAKLGIGVAALLFVLLHIRFRGARGLLTLACAVYAAVLVWHLGCLQLAAPLVG